MKTHKFARKPFYVDAVRVSETNIEEVAQWCEGEIKTDSQGLRYIHVTNVHRPLNDKQTQAYLGDWVLLYGSGFKVYIPKAFDKSFEKVKTLTKAQADEAGIKVPHEPKRKPSGQRPVPTAPKAKGDVKKPFAVEPDVDYRSAETGQYVSEEFAAANPDTTVAETDSVLEQQLPAAKKSKADLEAEALIAEVQAIREKPGR